MLSDFHLESNGKKQFQLRRDGTTIGRNAFASIQLLNIPNLEEIQLEIIKNSAGVLTITNFAQKAKVFLNERPLQLRESVPLKIEDVIQVGGLEPDVQDHQATDGKDQYEVFTVRRGPTDEYNEQNQSNDGSSTIPLNDSTAAPAEVVYISSSSEPENSDTEKQLPAAVNRPVAVKVQKNQPTKGVLEESLSTVMLVNDLLGLDTDPSELTRVDSLNWAAEYNESSPRRGRETSSAAAKEEVQTVASALPAQSHKVLTERDTNTAQNNRKGPELIEKKALTLLKVLKKEELSSSSSSEDNDEDGGEFKPAVRKRHVINDEYESGSSLSPGSCSTSSENSMDMSKPPDQSDTEDSTKELSEPDSEDLPLKVPLKRKRRGNMMWPSMKERMKRTKRTMRQISKICDE